MAGLSFTVDSGEIAVTAATALTVLHLLTPPSQRVRITGILYSMKGGSISAKCRLLRQTNAGTGTMTKVTPQKTVPDFPEDIQTLCYKNATVEPSNNGNALKTVEGPSYEISLPQTPPKYDVPGGQRVGLEITADSTGTVQCWLECEE